MKMTETVLIFGGSGGLGRALAVSLKARGMTPHLAGRNSEKLAAVADELGCKWTQADVTDPAAVALAVAEAAGDGALAGLAYAVGTINLKPLSRLSPADFDNDFNVNARGAALAIQAALPALRKSERAASVLLFSSVAVAQGFTAHASISMAKGAIEGLTLALAAELSPKIRVNCIAPSLTRTPLAAALTNNATMADAIAGLHALPRLGVPEDIAPMGALLLSPDADWITGQIIGIDGGRSSLRTKG
jgi:NAD(P)-dependent dehydrogenase (short-subunit alcohol dehydrogenase family)